MIDMKSLDANPSCCGNAIKEKDPAETPLATYVLPVYVSREGTKRHTIHLTVQAETLLLSPQIQRTIIKESFGHNPPQIVAKLQRRTVFVTEE